MSKSTNDDGGGREALSVIHINVPRAIKARWVKASQARGIKLTDWIIERIEARVNVYPIPDTIASQYHGAGYALAASVGGQIVALRYLADVAPELDDALAEGGSAARGVAVRWLASDAPGPIVRELQALGKVHAGMCSAWEFVEL